MSAGEQIAEGAWKALPAIVLGAIGGAWAWLVKARKRWARERHMKRLEAKAIRYLLDAQRHTLRMWVPIDRAHPVEPDELGRQKVLIDGVRDELWIADGHAGEGERERAVTDIVKVLTRTQSIQAKADKTRQDVFRVDDLEGF